LIPRRPVVAFTAPPQFPDLHDDWPLVRAALDRDGVDSVAVVWSDPSVDWSAFDLVVANGAWDNIHHPDAFLAWVAARERDGTPTVNSPATLRWNLDKRYLRELEAAGVPIVPTSWVEPGADGDGAEVSLPEGEVVVKPSISGGGHRTARYRPDEHGDARAHCRDLVASGRTAMIQPYQAAVDELGELGLVFLDGEYSHAIHKDPMIRRGAGPRESLIDNQVVRPATASDHHIDLGRRAVAAAARLVGPPTYARVDIVEGADGEPALLELELLDPVLFFAVVPERTTAFAAVVRERLGTL
jgi:glutathione synthase/RimK-type ligase-like ATP-grasp enzyme